MMNLQPLWISFQVSFIATLLSGIVGVALAGWMCHQNFWGRSVLDAIVSSPMVLPPTVLGYYLLVILGRTSFIGNFFETMTGHPIVFTKLGAVIAATIGAFPFVVKASRSAMEQVSPDLMGAARTLGATPLRAFLTITLPLSKSGILAGLTLGFSRGLGDFGVTLMVAGNIPNSTQTGALAIYDAVQSNHNREAFWMSFAMTTIAMVSLMVVNILSRNKNHE